VGFGLTSAPGGSICIDDYDRQDVRGDCYVVEDRPHNNKLISLVTEQGPLQMFMFVPDPFNVLDFISYNTATQAEGFRAKRMVNLRTGTGGISVDGDIFRRNVHGERVETPLPTAGDAFEVLTGEFGMLLTDPLRDVAVNELFPF